MANEKRLIDANGSYTLNATDNTGHSLCFGGGIISVMDIRGRCVCEFFSDDAPTVDAVEVVRCKDCAYNVYGDCDFSELNDPHYDPYWFCSDGERLNDSK